jgi:hypothetical protein
MLLCVLLGWQLGLLERHIVDNILPVKERLLAQMAAAEVRPCSRLHLLKHAFIVFRIVEVCA